MISNHAGQLGAAPSPQKTFLTHGSKHVLPLGTFLHQSSWQARGASILCARKLLLYHQAPTRSLPRQLPAPLIKINIPTSRLPVMLVAHHTCSQWTNSDSPAPCKVCVCVYPMQPSLLTSVNRWSGTISRSTHTAIDQVQRRTERNWVATPCVSHSAGA